MDTPARLFLDESRRFLGEEFLPKIQNAVGRMNDDDLWWRPNDVSNSVGNLLLHLAGNIRQWIVSGLGGAPDLRDRNSEFDRREPLSREELLANLEAAVSDVDRVLAALDQAALDRTLEIQGYEVTGLRAIYHVVEHFSMHTGQILYIAKMRGGEDLDFYRVDGQVSTSGW